MRLSCYLDIEVVGLQFYTKTLLYEQIKQTWEKRHDCIVDDDDDDIIYAEAGTTAAFAAATC